MRCLPCLTRWRAPRLSLAGDCHHFGGKRPLNNAAPAKRSGYAISQASNQLAYALISSLAFAQTCCPAGPRAGGQSVREHGPAVGQMHSRRLRPGSRRPSAGSSTLRASTKKERGARPPAAHSGYLHDPTSDLPPHCPLRSPIKALIDEATNQCVNALTGSAQLQNCSFEDDAGRAEDKRTGLSCPDRQAALAKQFLNRCAGYAKHLVCSGSYPNTVWPIYFGDISAVTRNFARVELCGAPLRCTLAKKPPSLGR